MEYKILDTISSPDDLRKLDVEQLPALCADIRAYMLDCCSRNPGHVASSLGAVEIITALHYIFNTPEDKIVFDVGHQAYAHKILTGRKEAFMGNRTRGGISGFPRMDESPYDTFGVGHSSTSISAALGMAEAARLRGSGEKVVAVIGDGALTGGLAFEGLNNAGNSNANLLVILNDNNQSIDSNIGGLHNHLLKLTTSRAYNIVKDTVWKHLGETRTRNFFQRWTRSLKAWAVKQTGGDLFESLGFRYFGPVDGNDTAKLTAALRKLRDMKGPRILHCYTVKGKGFAPAEAAPSIWHAPGRFDPKTGERFPSPHPFDRYQDVFGQTLIELAALDPKVVGITPAMASGCGMSLLAQTMPDRFFDVGIEEEHAVTFAAGLAASGMRPFCNIYSSFAQRAYDQIIHDVALQKLPVTLCLDRAGLVGEDGSTHQGVFDLSSLRCVPGLIITAPRDEAELRNAMYTALKQDGPFIIRYPRGMGEGAEWRGIQFRELPMKGEKLREGAGIAILTLGPAAYRALEAAEDFTAAGNGEPAVYDMRMLKPLDTAMLDEAMESCKHIITVEDGTLKGGLFGAVCEYAASRHSGVEVHGIGICDEFVPHSTQMQQRAEYGISREGILNVLKSV